MQMKSTACLALAGATLVSFAAHAGTINPSAAAAAFAERQAMCDRDGGKLWGKDLCGPLFFVDPQSRAVAANVNAADGSLAKTGNVFTGTLDKNVLISNTAADWKGQRWSMVMWPLPDDAPTRDAMLMHESWHRIQADIGLPPRDPIQAQLATEFGRVSLRMEWRALAAALTATDDVARKSAIRDALIFRAWRHAHFPDTASREDQLELNEGLAEYTGRRLSGQSDAQVAQGIREWEKNDAFARAFAYASGPGYGFLLDHYSQDWRRHLTLNSDLGDMLEEAAAISFPGNIGVAARKEGRKYDLATVQKEEKAKAEAHDRQAKVWTQTLVTGPVLHLPAKKLNAQFNPSTLFPLPPNGTVYPTLQAIAEWGKLTASEGALIDDNWTGVTVSAPADAATLSGKGWTLELKPGWTIVPGKKPGDFTVTKAN
jgi:hypothetical protein